MKKFVVSEKCIACGNCLLETKLLQGCACQWWLF